MAQLPHLLAKTLRQTHIAFCLNIFNSEECGKQIEDPGRVLMLVVSQVDCQAWAGIDQDICECISTKYHTQQQQPGIEIDDLGSPMPGFFGDLELLFLQQGQIIVPSR